MGLRPVFLSNPGFFRMQPAAMSIQDVALLVSSSLLMMVNVIEWYLLEHEQSAA